MLSMKSTILTTILFFYYCSTFVSSYNPHAVGNTDRFNIHAAEITTPDKNRRAFLISSSSSIAGWATLTGTNVEPANAAESTITQSIDVSPLAHTFILSSTKGEPKAKPIRENDATRILTNARVVLVFDGGNVGGDGIGSIRTVQQILDLTERRKAGQGPGVTPGKVKVIVPSTSDAIAKAAVESGVGVIINSKVGSNPSDALKTLATDINKVLEDGDVVFLYPQLSKGTYNDGKFVQEAASTVNLPIGSAKSGGLVSILVNGPKGSSNPLKIVDGGYETCTLMWYDIE